MMTDKEHIKFLEEEYIKSLQENLKSRGTIVDLTHQLDQMMDNYFHIKQVAEELMNVIEKNQFLIIKSAIYEHLKQIKVGNIQVINLKHWEV